MTTTSSTTSRPRVLPLSSSNPKVIQVLRTLFLVSIAGFMSPISQLCLAPVYGSVPAKLHHSSLIVLTATLVYISRQFLRNLPYQDYDFLIAPLIYWTLPLQHRLFQYSEYFGAEWGPFVTETITFAPILYLVLLAASFAIDDLNLSSLVGSSVNKLITTVGLANKLSAPIAVGFFAITEQSANFIVPSLIRHFTRVELLLIAATAATLATRARILTLFLLAAPAIFHTLVLNPHHHSLLTNKVLNATLNQYDYALLDRRDSLTGYLSVLYNANAGFLAMRCDHSLLGGEWILTPKNKNRGLQHRETIYGAFNLLEAVRLIQVQSVSSDDEKDALFIGLGVGTAPKAFIAHGINTTIVEIDPVVHEFATKYFELPPNHNKIIADAIDWAHQATKSQPQSFDYIIHDVFSGGVEPIELFTQEFLRDLSSLLKEYGAIAINYAADLNSPAARIILNTIHAVFPTCRTYRDTFPIMVNDPFVNMVAFCVKTPTTIKWRSPKVEDLLGIESRRDYLPPHNGLELKIDRIGGKFLIMENKKKQPWTKWDIVTGGNTTIFQHFRRKAGLWHWDIMRNITLIPKQIWETW